MYNIFIYIWIYVYIYIHIFYLLISSGKETIAVSQSLERAFRDVQRHPTEIEVFRVGGVGGES